MVITVHQISKYGPSFKGGIETESENIKRVLLSKGYYVKMLYFSSKCDAPGVTQRSNLVETVCRTQFKIFNQPVSIQYIAEILRIKSTEIIHLHLPNYVGMIACCLLPTDTKIVVHWHSDVIGRRLLKLLMYPAEKILLRRAYKILCTSQEYAEHSSSLKAFLEKVEVLPIASERIEKIGKRSLSHDENIKILNVGRLVEYKNHSFLIDVIKLLPSHYQLDIVGSGKLKSKILDKIKKEGLSERIRIISGLTKKQLHQKYLESHVFALSSNSRAEAYGVVLVEALSFALPIVSMKIVGSGVLFVNKDGFSGLHSAIGCPLGMAFRVMRITKDNKSYSDFSKNAVAHHSGLLTPELHEATLSNIYSEL